MHSNHSSHPVHLRHWLPADLAALVQLGSSRTTEFSDVGRLGASIVTRHPGLLHMVSGPITSGLTMGREHSREDNLKVFGAVIERLADIEGLDMFSQMPFEDILGVLDGRWKASNPAADYCRPLLDGFYRPVFETGLIDTMHFMHGYETSKGARWEFEVCAELGIKTRLLPKRLSEKIYGSLFPLTVSQR